jgi:proton glutamate symport protein
MKRRVPMHIKIIISLLLGIAVGVALNLLWSAESWGALGVGDKAAYLAGQTSDANTDAGLAAAGVRFLIEGCDFLGKLFIRALRFIAVPIVLFSLVAGAASLGDVRKLGRIGGKTLLIFLVMTCTSIVIGITLTRTIKPGEYITDASREQLMAQYAEQAARSAADGQTRADAISAWDQILHIVPINPFAALATAEMIQVVALAIAVGAALTLLPIERSRRVTEVCEVMTEVMTIIVNTVMRLAPVAVFALIAPIIATTGLDVLRALGVYVAVVVTGLASVSFIVYPIALWLATPAGNKMTFSRFYRGMAPAQLLAFSSSSSNATLPVNMQCARKLGVPDDIVSFVLPLGATMNMNGTAMYQSVVAIFLAQFYNIDLTLGDQAMIVLTATLVSIGSAGVPGASIVLMIVVLQSIHVPPQGIAIILGMDRLLDMCRTVVNTGGDAMTAVIVAASEKTLGPAGGERAENGVQR